MLNKGFPLPQTCEGFSWSSKVVAYVLWFLQNFLECGFWKFLSRKKKKTCRCRVQARSRRVFLVTQSRKEILCSRNISFFWVAQNRDVSLWAGQGHSQFLGCINLRHTNFESHMPHNYFLGRAKSTKVIGCRKITTHLF